MDHLSWVYGVPASGAYIVSESEMANFSRKGPNPLYILARYSPVQVAVLQSIPLSATVPCSLASDKPVDLRTRHLAASAQGSIQAEDKKSRCAPCLEVIREKFLIRKRETVDFLYKN